MAGRGRTSSTAADPGAWYTSTAEQMGQEAYEDYRRAIHNPDTVHAMMEDYRAGLGIDREHDEADHAAGRRISCHLHGFFNQADLERDYHALYAPSATPTTAMQTRGQGACLCIATARPECA